MNQQPRVLFTGPPGFVPVYASSHAAGADIRAYLENPVIISPGERSVIPTGLKMAIPEGWEAQIRPRSGLAFRNGVTVLNSPGTIDADYRGELKLLIINLGAAPFTVEPGMRMAQIVLAAAPQAFFEEVTDLPGTERGDGGFGSTGV